MNQTKIPIQLLAAMTTVSCSNRADEVVNIPHF